MKRRYWIICRSVVVNHGVTDSDIGRASSSPYGYPLKLNTPKMQRGAFPCGREKSTHALNERALPENGPVSPTINLPLWLR